VIVLALAAAVLASSPRPPAVGVGLQEWQVAVYRSQVPAGRIRLNVTNLGEDTHDLVVRTRAGKVLKRLEPIRPGGRRRAELRLRKPGRYTLFCSIADHESRGMKARLRVR
jgi:FtsP/CotA-like multicopper oxidase with cupredoxin domain